MRFIIDANSTNPDPEKVRGVLEKELGFIFGKGQFYLDMVPEGWTITIKAPFKGDRE